MPDPVKMEASVHAYVAAFDRGDPDAAVALFAPDATVEDPVGTPLHSGLEAIRAFFAQAMAYGVKMGLQGPVRVTKEYAAFAFRADLPADGTDKWADVIETFRFDEDNRITEMRAYFGPGNMHGF